MAQATATSHFSILLVGSISCFCCFCAYEPCIWKYVLAMTSLKCNLIIHVNICNGGGVHVEYFLIIEARYVTGSSGSGPYHPACCTYTAQGMYQVIEQF